MKEQVITPRMSARGASGGKGRGGGIVQKPARRDRSATGSGSNSRARSNGALRKALVYLPLFGKIMLAALLGVMLFKGYRAAASAAFFQARSVDVNQTTHASQDEIEAVVRRETEQLGVWRVDLASLSAELEKLAWVRRAVVSRVLPDGLRVRVTERSPLAVVRTAKGKFIWVDEDAVTLGPMLATDRQPTFFIRGWDEAEKPEAASSNRARIQKYLELMREWDAAGLSERISEVDLTNVRDVSVQLTGDDAQVTVRLGNKDFGNRLRNALNALAENQSTPGRPPITLIQTFDNRTIMGKSETETSGENREESNAPTGADNAVTAPPKPAGAPSDASRRNKRSASDISKKEKEQRDKKEQARKEQAKKEEPKSRAKGETRPRRIG